MGEWVLILLFIGSSNGGVGMTSASFADKGACEFALEGARESFWRGTVQGFCTPKHIEKN